MKPFRSALLLMVLSSIALSGWAAAAAQPAELLRQTVTTLARARDSIVQNQLDGLNSQTVGPGEVSSRSQHSREDVLLFISYLDGRIYQSCRELYLLAGQGGLEGLPCQAGGGDPSGISRFDPVPEVKGQTSGEKLAGLEGELNEALGEFDEMLLKEQERIAAHVPRQRESGGTVAGVASSGPGQGPSGEQSDAGAAAGGPDRPSGTESSTDSSAGAGTSADGVAGGGQQQTRPPATSGSREISSADDDIVARQLREAAEQERDPEIKAKLWEEYKKYKEGIK